MTRHPGKETAAPAAEQQRGAIEVMPTPAEEAYWIEREPHLAEMPADERALAIEWRRGHEAKPTPKRPPRRRVRRAAPLPPIPLHYLDAPATLAALPLYVSAMQPPDLMEAAEAVAKKAEARAAEAKTGKARAVEKLKAAEARAAASAASEARAAAERAVVRLYRAELEKAGGDQRAIDPTLRMAWTQLAQCAPLRFLRALDPPDQRGRPENGDRDLLIACMVQEAIDADAGTDRGKKGRAHRAVLDSYGRQHGIYTTGQIGKIYRKQARHRDGLELRASLQLRALDRAAGRPVTGDF